MISDKKILALIPARGGSKGIPNKNIRMLNGKPLIAWTIDQAKSSQYIDNVIVSTDSQEIAHVAKDLGVGISLRPNHLATDTARTMDVVLYTLETFKADILVLLQPTSPLRTADHIKAALDLYINKKAKAVVSVAEVEHPPYWMNVLPSDGCMKDFLTDNGLGHQRQDFPKYYRLTGAIYVAESEMLKQEKTFMTKDTYAYIMPQDCSVDIDTLFDFKIAEFLMRDQENESL
jgi:CMP-N-acetylneuraminic acid synthetase